MSNQDLATVSNYLGVHRLRSYLDATHGNLDQTLELYEWNSEISAEVFRILADVEIFLRNGIDRELQIFNVTLGNHSTWLDDLTHLIPPVRRLDVERAKHYLYADGKPLDHLNIVSQLNFGFWRSFLVKWHKDLLWPKALRYAFPYSPSRKPEYIFTRVRHLHVLRNRIAHHDPIHQRDIARDVQICIEVLNAISPTIAAWSTENSRALEVLAEKPR
ncbi:MAG: Abi family protein [Candidatus Nanopelagicaceae bacterium]|nr:Abi family protein [Candidatus Nanopelagicaceae bacterium]